MSQQTCITVYSSSDLIPVSQRIAKEEQQWCDDNLVAWWEFTSYTQLRELVKTVNQ